MFWPLLNYGRISNNVRVEDARFQQLLVEYVDTVLRAAQEVEDGIAGYLREQDATVFAQNAVAAAETAVKLALVQYREGAVDYSASSTRSVRCSSRRTSWPQTRSSVVTNLIALYKALGGGWELRQVNRSSPTDTAQMQERTNWGDCSSRTPGDRSRHPAEE